jgi:hypothetical protein
MIIYVAAFRDVLLDLVGRRQPKKGEAFLECCVVGNGPEVSAVRSEHAGQRVGIAGV